MRRPRRNHRPQFKARVALAAVKGEKTLDKIHALTVLEDMPGKGFMQDALVAAKIVERSTGFSKGCVLFADKTIGA